MNRFAREHGELIMVVLTILAVIILLVWAGVRHERERAKCKDNGGSYEKYNCHLTSAVTTDGKTATVNTYEVCDYRCVGAHTEDGR